MGTALADAPIEIRPQPGPQEAFLSSPADIVIYGGQAGGGKTWGLLLEAIRHTDNPGFGAVIFRQTSPMIRNTGALWDESGTLYPDCGAVPRESLLEWTFPSGATVKFRHLEHEDDKLNWQGAQIPLIGFDELTHFSESQFFYLLSRNRSTCGVPPYIRATTNPDADSWVAGFIAWWIDAENGYPILERGGVLRWFIRVNDTLVWADDSATLHRKHPGSLPKSVTFIPASVHDNQALLTVDPGYLANLMALPTVERERLLGGNWKIRPAAGLVFDRGWFETVGAPPAPRLSRRVRYWDKAGTAGAGDWTVGTLLSEAAGVFYVEDVIRGQWAAGERENVISQAMRADPPGTRVGVEQEPGSGGKDSARLTVTRNPGYTVQADRPTGQLIERAQPLAAQCQVGNVKLVAGPWNEPWLREMHAFPTAGVPDDQVASAAGAFKWLVLGVRDDTPFHRVQARI